MSLLAQKLERVSLLLQGVGVGISRAVHLKFGGLYLHSLPLALRFHKCALHMERGSGRDEAQVIVGEFRQIKYNLERLDRRAVVKGHELHVFIASA